jgi:hypothetical protein
VITADFEAEYDASCEQVLIACVQDALRKELQGNVKVDIQSCVYFATPSLVSVAKRRIARWNRLFLVFPLKILLDILVCDKIHKRDDSHDE